MSEQPLPADLCMRRQPRQQRSQETVARIEQATLALLQEQGFPALNTNAIASVKAVYDRGVAQGVFRPGLDPVDIHSAISAFTFFNVSNRHTFGLIFQDRASQDKADTLKRVHVVELILRFVCHSLAA